MARLTLKETELSLRELAEWLPDKAILQQRERIKRKTIETRRLHHRERAAQYTQRDEPISLSIQTAIGTKNHDDGHFQRPVLVLNADPSLSVVYREQFGPILPLVPLETEEDAIAMANDDPFGLASSVWTSDMERAVAPDRSGVYALSQAMR